MRELIVASEAWSLVSPFHITGYTFHNLSLVHVVLREGEHQGQGEAAGVYYLGETAESMMAQIESVREAVCGGADREELLSLLPAGGARNAIDCALWDLEAKRTGKRVWELLALRPEAVTTVNTVGIDTPEAMAETALGLDSTQLKVKLDGTLPLERLRAVRAARPDATLVIDVNGGWTEAKLRALAPAFHELGVAMIEQPLPRGADAALEHYRPPLPLCADESCVDSSEFEQAARRYQMINIKLDKTGGLTEALRLTALAQQRGLGLMVGNMVGTSLAMAPGFIIAQHCQFVDLDGALFLTRDREPPMAYEGGVLQAPAAALWG